MDPETQHRVHVIIGIFTISCFATSLIYGSDAIVAWALGMLVLAALINAFCQTNNP